MVCKPSPDHRVPNGPTRWYLVNWAIWRLWPACVGNQCTLLGGEQSGVRRMPFNDVRWAVWIRTRLGMWTDSQLRLIWHLARQPIHIGGWNGVFGMSHYITIYFRMNLHRAHSGRHIVGPIYAYILKCQCVNGIFLDIYWFICQYHL